MEGAQETSVSTCSFIPKELSAEELSESEFITNGLFTENNEDAVSLSSNSRETNTSSSKCIQTDGEEEEEEYDKIRNIKRSMEEEDSKLSNDELIGSDEYIFQDLFTGNRTLTSEEFAEKILYLTDLITKEREEKYRLKRKVRNLEEERRLEAYDLEELRQELVHCRKEKQNYQRQAEILQQEKLYFKSRLDEQIERGSQDTDSNWSLQNEVRDLQMRLEDMEQQVVEANNYSTNLKTKLEKKSEEVVQLKAKEQAYHEREETLRKERDALIRSNAEAVQTVEQLRHTWNSVREQLRMEVSRRKQQENDYRMRLNEVELKSRKLKEENENLKFAMQNLENLLEEKQLACENNQQLIENYETQIVSLNEELKQLKEVRNSLQQQLIETTEQLQERDDIVEKLQCSLESKTRRCEDLEKAFQSVQEREDDLVRKIKTLQDECNRLKKDKEHLQGVREEAVAELESYGSQLESVEEQRIKLEEQVQSLQMMLQKSHSEEGKLRVKCENQKQLLEEYEKQLEKTCNLQESEIFQQVCDLLDQKFPKNDSDEQKSVILQLADKVQQLCDEKDEMIAIIDHMKRELDASKKLEEQYAETDWKDLLQQREREIFQLEARLQQMSEEKTFAENELRLLQKELEQIRGYNSFDKSELSSSKLSTSFSEQSLQKILKAFDNLVHEKKILSHKNKELNERLRITLESRELDEETTRSLLKESQTIQQQLCGIISAHESVLNEMKEEPVSPYPIVYSKDIEEDKENRDMNSSVVSAYDEPLIRAMNTHIFQLRNMWLHELDNNAELRKIVVHLHQKKSNENICHRGVQCSDIVQATSHDTSPSSNFLETINDLKERNSCLEQDVEEYKTKLYESSNQLEELRGKWHSWVSKLYQLLPCQDSTESNVERICLHVFNYFKSIIHKCDSLYAEISTLERENRLKNDSLMNLKAQKSFFLYAMEKNNCLSLVQVVTHDKPKERLKTYLLSLLGMWRLVFVENIQSAEKSSYYMQAPQCAKSFDYKKEMENVMNSALIPRLQNEINQKNKVILQLERRIASLQEKRRQELGEMDNGVGGDIPYKSLRIMLEEKDAKLKQGQQMIERLQSQREKLQLQITNISKELESLAASESRERFAKESAESRIQILNKKLSAEMKKAEALKKQLYEREKKFQDTVAQLLSKTEESFSSEYGSTGGGLRQSPRCSPAFNSPPVKESSSMKKKKSPRHSLQKDDENMRRNGASLISQFHQVSDSKAKTPSKNSASLVDHILSSAEASLSKAKKDDTTEESVQELREHIQELRNASMKLMSKTTM